MPPRFRRFVRTEEILDDVWVINKIILLEEHERIQFGRYKYVPVNEVIF